MQQKRRENSNLLGKPPALQAGYTGSNPVGDAAGITGESATRPGGGDPGGNNGGNSKNGPPLRVEAAAIRLDSGQVVYLPRPQRHNHIIAELGKAGRRQCSGDVQGFLLSNGRFADRYEAYRVAQDAGQILPRRLGGGPRLFSEDVW